jgi:hypothetical protein
VIVVIGINIFGEIELDVSQSDALSFAAARIFLYDFEMNPQLLQHLVLADNKAHGSLFLVVEDNLVILNVALGGATAMFGSARRGEVPFDEAGAGYQGNVVQVVDF